MAHLSHSNELRTKHTAAGNSTGAQAAGQSGIHHVDNRPGTVAQRKLNDAMNNAVCTPVAFGGEGTVQLYSYGRGSTAKIKVEGKNDSCTFEECFYNSVEYKKGDKKVQGTGTKSPAAWAGWLVNQKNGHNATQLHVVNARWGGMGGQNDGNIVPGSPLENNHHLHDAEKKFDACFDGSNKALSDCKYECKVSPDYGDTVGVKTGNVLCQDPKIEVDITTPSGKTAYSVRDGDGLKFVDAS